MRVQGAGGQTNYRLQNVYVHEYKSCGVSASLLKQQRGDHRHMTNTQTPLAFGIVLATSGSPWFLWIFYERLRRLYIMYCVSYMHCNHSVVTVSCLANAHGFACIPFLLEYFLPYLSLMFTFVVLSKLIPTHVTLSMDIYLYIQTYICLHICIVCLSISLSI